MSMTSTPVRDGLMRVLGAVTTPLVPADYLDVIDPLRSGAALRGRIQAITPETADAATVLIRPGRGWQGHLPGQYVRIGIDVDGVRLWRAYSLTSGPRRDGLIAITVKAIPDGKGQQPHRAPRPPGDGHPARPGHRRLPPAGRARRGGSCSSPPAAASPR